SNRVGLANQGRRDVSPWVFTLISPPADAQIHVFPAASTSGAAELNGLPTSTAGHNGFPAADTPCSRPSCACTRSEPSPPIPNPLIGAPARYSQITRGPPASSNRQTTRSCGAVAIFPAPLETGACRLGRGLPDSEATVADQQQCIGGNLTR